MEPISRRNLTLSLIAGSLSAGVLGGCTTAKTGAARPFGQINKFRVKRADKPVKAFTDEIGSTQMMITHPERKEEFNKQWREVVYHTDAMEVSDNRIQIRAEGTLLAGKNISEQNFFIRAAAETLRKGKDGFVIKQIDFFSDRMPWASLGSNFNLSSRSWIGNYEDFKANRNEQNIFSSRRSIRNKGMDGVILLLDKDDFPNRDRFTAADIYLNILNYKAK